LTQHGCRVPSLLVGVVLLGACSAALSAEEAAVPAETEVYVRKATWPETVLAARARLTHWREESSMELGTWHTTGPLDARDFDEALFPEHGVDLEAKSNDGRPLWQARPEWKDGQVEMLPGSHRAATYLFRTITAGRATAVEAGLGSDDGLAVWLNGEKLLANNVARGPAPNQDHVTLRLRPGENRLLMKVFNQGGGHGFCFALGEALSDDVWQQFERDFPVQSDWMKRHLRDNQHLAWFESTDGAEVEKAMLTAALKELGQWAGVFQGEFEILSRQEAPADDPRWLALYERVCRFQHRPDEAKQINLLALRRAIEDLTATFPDRYRGGPEFLRRLDELEKQVAAMEMDLARGDAGAAGRAGALVGHFERLRREALLANPLLDFDRLLFVRRKADQLGLPQNWQGNCAMARNGYDNEIAVLSPVSPDGKQTTVYRPDGGAFVGDVDLHFNAGRMLFSMPGGEHNRWQIWEIGVDGSGLRQVTSGEEPDADNYDACYLPDGRIVFCSTRCFQGVPCVGGGNTVANLCIMDADGQNVRQLCFDQDHNWCPTVLNNGRVLYSRWEYSDLPHYFSRLLFHMNPDGTGQMEYYASNSMWPNSIFYARPLADHPTKVVAVISGHHGVPRMGELLIFDPARGRREARGAVQRIPGCGHRVEPVIRDGLVEGSWPKFLHPYPLSEKHFLVSSKPTPESNWGIYLVDVFDNMLPIKEEPGYACFEPVPLRATPPPPVIPDRVNLARDEATVYLSDVYKGRGLANVPRGAVKKLRLYSPHYAYPGMGGHIHIGIDGPWDVHRILGTVPVGPDGSAAFTVPANTPIAVQPLDEKGRALQVMRSWFTAMPGEVLSCVGCHESQNTGPPSKFRLASFRKPVPITPWYGPERGFSFKRDVQPALDKYCVGCHNGQKYEGQDVPDLRVDGSERWRNFTPSYVALHPFVRRPGPESDYHLQKPLEFHASTSELVQILEKGHYGVELDAEAWDRLTTWIDLNVPDHGTWHEHRGGHSPWEERRREMRAKYAGRPEDPEEIVEASVPGEPVAFVEPKRAPARNTQHVDCPKWPFDEATAKGRQAEAGEPERKVGLPDGSTLDMLLIPAGEFVMGSADGPPDEYPPARVRIEKPFYMARFEVTNAQYALFDPEHDSAYISMPNKDHGSRGHAVNHPSQPVVRITWQRAADFCRWLSDATGLRFALPTEAQWEWACRAGSDRPFSYGDSNADFSEFANLADIALDNFARGDSPKWHPKDRRFDDHAMVTAPVGRYQPNPWGLHDMHGNVAEWTRTTWRPYPYAPRDGRDNPQTAGEKVVRGGSWYDRPYRARSAFRLHYQAWQPVYNVGFRVIAEVE